MDVIMNRYLRMAIDQALSHKFDEKMDYEHCAVLVKGGSVISVGFNKLNTNGFMEHYASKVKGSNRNWCLSTHAECSACLIARKKTDLTGAKIYVARIRPPSSPNGKVGMSRPCEICTKVLIAYGISKAYYTIDDYSYGIMDIRKMRDERVEISSEE